MLSCKQSWVTDMKPSAIHSGTCDARGDSESFCCCSSWSRSNQKMLKLRKARMQRHLKRSKDVCVVRQTHTTFLRHVVSSVFELCFGAISPFLSRGDECLLWISTSSNKALFSLMTPKFPVNWEWKLPKQRQYQRTKNMWLPLSESEAWIKRAESDEW